MNETGTLRRLPIKDEFEQLFAKLKSGKTRSQVEADIKGLLYYPTLELLICEVSSGFGNIEAQKLVIDIFKERLGRCPRQDGLTYWAGIYPRADTDAVLAY